MVIVEYLKSAIEVLVSLKEDDMAMMGDGQLHGH